MKICRVASTLFYMTHNHASPATSRNSLSGQQRAFSRRLPVFIVTLFFLGTGLVQAQTDPWSKAAGLLSTAFSGPIVRGFAIVCVVLGGLELALDTGGHGKKIVGALVFGLGMALGAANFITWLFS